MVFIRGTHAPDIAASCHFNPWMHSGNSLPS
jgi:hypothetical protein